MSLKVLVVDDEESFVDALCVGLQGEGFAVDVARDGPEALNRFDASTPDIVLLDLMLPGLSGLDVCREIRSRSMVPIIMVTARDSEVDAVVGLELGADDYITKPYGLRELVARIRATVRRSRSQLSIDELMADPILEVGDLRLDPERHEVQVRGAAIHLPLKEFELLEALMDNAGRVVSRDTLIDQVWGPDYVGDTKTLDVHIKRLRARVEPDPANPTRISTVRGVGYRFENGR
jgi:two-component system, OmpR family, response regulator RegX3